MAHHLAASLRRNDPDMTNLCDRADTIIRGMVATLCLKAFAGGLCNVLQGNTYQSVEMVAIDLDNLIPSSTGSGTLTLAEASLAIQPMIDFVRTGTALRHVMIVASRTCETRN
jgi:hypothetical protein